MDDDYLNIYEYVGEEKHEYTAATNISKEEHEMKKMASPQELKFTSKHNSTRVPLTLMDSKSKLKKVLSRKQQRVLFSHC